MDRRAFLTNVAAAGAAVGLAPLSPVAAEAAVTSGHAGKVGVPPVGAPVGSAESAARSLSRALFSRARSARFSVAGHDGRRLELSDLREGPRASALDQFSVTFRETTAGVAPLSHGSYVLEHPAHGRLQLHLEPVTDGPAGVCYRATFCLLVQA